MHLAYVLPLLLMVTITFNDYHFLNKEAIIKPASRSKCYFFSHSSYSAKFHDPLNWKCIFTGPAEQICGTFKNWFK